MPGSGVAACAGAGSARLVTFTPSGQSAAYWLNGTAKATGHYLDLQAIWAEDPTNPGARLSMQDLTEYALSLCG